MSISVSQSIPSNIDESPHTCGSTRVTQKLAPHAVSSEAFELALLVERVAAPRTGLPLTCSSGVDALAWGAFPLSCSVWYDLRLSLEAPDELGEGVAFAMRSRVERKREV